jgi:hypothetical protein
MKMLKFSTMDIIKVSGKIEKLNEALTKALQRDQSGAIVVTNEEADLIGNMIVDIAKSIDKNT